MNQTTIPEFASRCNCQVSLRMLFFITTAFGCWLGLQLSMVRERQSMLRHLRETGTIEIVTASTWVGRYPAMAKPAGIATVPTIRELLGDEAVQEFSYTGGRWSSTSSKELREIARLFPEASISEEKWWSCTCGSGSEFIELP